MPSPSGATVCGRDHATPTPEGIRGNASPGPATSLGWRSELGSTERSGTQGHSVEGLARPGVCTLILWGRATPDSPLWRGLGHPTTNTWHPTGAAIRAAALHDHGVGLRVALRFLAHFGSMRQIAVNQIYTKQTTIKYNGTAHKIRNRQPTTTTLRSNRNHRTASYPGR